MNDWGDWGLAFASAIITTLIVLLAMFVMNTSKMEDCTSRGGSVVETKDGWVCAKLERI